MKAIQTKYLGPTEHRGSRVKATDGDGNSCMLGWDNSLSADANHAAAAKMLALRMGWEGLLQSGAVCRCSRQYMTAWVWVTDTLDQVEVYDDTPEESRLTSALLSNVFDLYAVCCRLLDGLDANLDPLRGGLTQDEWDMRVAQARRVLSYCDGKED